MTLLPLLPEMPESPLKLAAPVQPTYDAFLLLTTSDFDSARASNSLMSAGICLCPVTFRDRDFVGKGSGGQYLCDERVRIQLHRLEPSRSCCRFLKPVNYRVGPFVWVPGRIGRAPR